MTWQTGRQGTGYLKKLIFQIGWPVKMDCWVIKYPAGSGIPVHQDQVESGNHHRLNLVLKRARSGGILKLNHNVVNKRWCYFRPDLIPHEVTTVHAGTRWVFSIGWITNDSKNSK